MSRFTPPYPHPMPKHGRILQLLLRPFKFLRSRSCAISALSDKAYNMHMGELVTPGQRIYIANQPDLIKRVLVDEAANFPKAQISSDMLELLLGDSIFVSNGEVWKRQRRMMDPAFEQARIKIVFDLMMEAADALFARLDAKADGRDTAIDEEMMHVTADIIFRTIFSQPLEGHEAKLIFAAFIRFQEEPSPRASPAPWACRHGPPPSAISWRRRRPRKSVACSIPLSRPVTTASMAASRSRIRISCNRWSR